jgi:hypothetical protein
LQTNFFLRREIEPLLLSAKKLFEGTHGAEEQDARSSRKGEE